MVKPCRQTAAIIEPYITIDQLIDKMYKFKPFVFTKHKRNSIEYPKARSGHRIVCDHKYLYSYGGFNPDFFFDDDSDMENDQAWISSKPLFKEIWKFNLVTQQWQRLPGQDNMPNELASNAVILRGNTLMVYGGTGVPFGESCSNRLYLCNLNNGFAYTCDIHRFDLRTGIWEKVYICSGIDQNEPSGRYRHELAFDGRLIYVLGGGTGSESFGFLQIHAFDLEMKKWVMLTTSGDNEDNTVPEPRRCHGCVQYTDQNTGVISVIISGGYNGEQGLLRSKIFSDVWRLDLNNLQWTCLRKCKIPRPLYFHSAALTPEGLMYTFGGTINKNNKVVRTDAVYSVWLRIPKLSEICWQALIHYFPHLCRKSRHQLLLMGVPSKFVQRIDFF
ncbi:scruin like at the midline isoform X2 [Ptiloglossa arizonensis]|uniref:scruin like at the midline isoform X2 n=1 Tax=Ptiloglossa arizonensis TaxID=3350558 RepID=UPI003FA0C6BC